LRHLSTNFLLAEKQRLDAVRLCLSYPNSGGNCAG